MESLRSSDELDEIVEVEEEMLYTPETDSEDHTDDDTDWEHDGSMTMKSKISIKSHTEQWTCNHTCLYWAFAHNVLLSLQDYRCTKWKCPSTSKVYSFLGEASDFI